jgi:PAS domain S-box-containing protein
MAAENKKQNNNGKLQKKAGKKIVSIRKMPVNRKDSSVEHELKVHRVELQMQNDELQNSERKLLKSVEEYTDLFDNAPVGYFILDKDGVIVNVNSAGSVQLGAHKKKLIGKPFSVFLSNASCQDRYYLHRNQALESNEKQQFVECEIKKVDGTSFSAMIESAVVLKKNQTFKHILCTVSDVSLQREYEHKLELSLMKEKELNELKSQFIATASHEFRTPLTTILSSAELLVKYNKTDDEENREKHIRKIIISVSRLKEVLSDFMSSSEIEKGEIKNTPEAFDLIEFIEKLLLEVWSYAGSHHVKYKHQGHNKSVYLDMKLLKTCLSNLITNAYKYSPAGSTIEIVTQYSKPENLIITIKDKGIGIPKKDQSRIFEPFYRGGNAEKIQGTGVGLDITKRLIAIMNGSISFTSKENSGTSFVLKFPAH